MNYRTAIVDELGELVAYCSEISDDEKCKILIEHPEYTVQTIPCEWDGYTLRW